MAFQHTKDAIDWCIQSQIALVQANWPEALLQHPGAAEEWADTDDRCAMLSSQPNQALRCSQRRCAICCAG
jgi:hypothetical protein